RLIEIARKTIQDHILNGTVMSFQETDPRLSAEEGAFVTLHKRKALRGCIGNIVARGPLYLTVRDMAIAAATQDPRFPAVTKEELDQLDIEISVLSQPRRCRDVREIEMGTHGVIVRKGIFHQGVFLPQVATETGWNREQFLSNLCAHKAGLPPDAWKDPKIQIEIFTADVFSQQDLEAVE
ncbi:MAG TPA: AmmeMemoRadiSam system protein A, partial [Candidatus Omnitrophota bacterium]|nr:AmmeMemoRadiSam system protein A [Candidatus Omnitrophota bacterium]